MFHFNYHYSDHVEYFHLFAKELDVAIENNCIFLPSQIGVGYIKVIELANGLQVLINEASIGKDVRFSRKAAASGSYTLRFDEVTSPGNLTFEMQDDILNENAQAYSGATLTNSLHEFTYTAQAGTYDRCVNIYFKEEWLNKNFGINSQDTELSKYLSLKTDIFNFEVLNFEYRQLMAEIFAVKTDSPMDRMVIQNRVMLLMEKFFSSLYYKIQNVAAQPEMAPGTLRRMMKVESMLVKDLSVLPPNIPALARSAMMSETKLKTIFKQLYGYSIYEYYQKSRMLKARQLLRSHQHSIKEIGRMLGFQNLSNFSIAYKKEFNMLPSDV